MLCRASYLLTFVVGTLSSVAGYAQLGAVTGKVTDQQSGESLIGALILIEGTSLGAVTGLDGQYRINGIREGEHNLVFGYLGYEEERQKVRVIGGETLVIDQGLAYNSVLISEVIITGNVEGQARALNQQRTSDNIKNIVSADLIGRFPDLNVAEALQRVPGVNITRSRGEGSTVSLRGTPAHFTAININGEQIPSTQDNGSRNESLDLIPADQLASMEIVKAITPDMDGDAIGGSINLRTPTARSTNLQLKAEAGMGYNSLSQGYNGIGRLKLSKRFFSDNYRNGRLGLVAGFSYFETDNEEDKLEAVWSPFGDTPVLSLERDTVVMENYQLSDLKNQRTRMGTTFTLDYEFDPDNEIIFNFMYSRRSDLDERNRLRVFLNESAGVQWQSLDTIRETELRRDVSLRDYYSENLSYNLEGQHSIKSVNLDWGLYYADSRRVEDALNGRFERGADFRVDLVSLNGPKGIYSEFPAFETLNSEFSLHNPFLINEISRYDIVDLDLTSSNAVAKVNASIPYNVGNSSGFFKAGIKARSQANNKDRVNNIHNFSDPNRVIDERAGFASVISDFEDQDFLNNEVRFGPGVSEIRFRSFVESNENLFVFDPIRSNRNTFNDSYSATEDILAAYLMNKLQINKLMLLAGLRYETNRVMYDAFSVNNITGEAIPIADETEYDFWLPNVHVKYGLTKFTNLRAAMTYSYARANFNDLVPFLSIDEDGSRIRAGNPELRPGSAFNLDLLVEHYFGSIGVLSGGLFYKNIDDFQFSRNLRFLRPGDPFYDEFPGFQFRQEQNGENAQVYGFELNSQLSLDFLPGILAGLGVYFNYTYTGSDATTSDRSDINLPGQAEHTWNGAMSFDYKGLSAKASVNYNGSFLRTVAGEARNDLVQEDRIQLDINTSYSITDRARIFAEFLNVTNSPSIVYQGIPERVADYAYFGWWNRFGISYNIR